VLLLIHMDKGQLRQAIIASLQKDFETQTRAALTSRDEATHEESKPENKYDMHAQEAAYLAEGQARLARELNEAIALYYALPVDVWAANEPAALGAWLTIEYKDRLTDYFIGPRHGGLEVAVDDRVVTVVTPTSPLGRQLLGARVGQVVHLPGHENVGVHRVVAIV
jgi:transcription elongation GreA/GreB family factor